MKIIYDCDAAADDAVALMYLLAQPEIEIAALTIVGTGEAHGLTGANNFADLCAYGNKPNIPMAYGRGECEDEHGTVFPDWLRTLADTLLDDKNIPHCVHATIPNNAVELIRHTLKNAAEPITLLATGPLTNIADFLLAYPELQSKIARIVIMGGTAYARGNIQALDKNSTNTVAEWNIYVDPKAAEIVFNSGVPLTMVGLDATNQVPMTKAFYDSLAQQTSPPLKFIYQLMKTIVDALGMDAFINDFYLWDPLAAMICANLTLGVTKKLAIEIDLNTGQTKPVANGKNKIDVVVDVKHANRILEMLINDINAGYHQQHNKLGFFYRQTAKELKTNTDQYILVQTRGNIL